MPLLHKLTKQDRDNIWFAAWQLRPHVRSALREYGKSAIGFLAFDDVIAVLREAEDKGLLEPAGAATNTIRNLQSKRRTHPGMNERSSRLDDD
jgi:hypothetical protein